MRPVIFGLAVGALAGVIVAVLLVPSSPSEMRDRIREKARQSSQSPT